MTLAFNSTAYSELLAQHQLRIIKTEAENEHFLATVEALLAHPQLSPEEAALLELLVKLIELFEAEHYALDSSTPTSRLLHLIESRQLALAELEPVLGARQAAAVVQENPISAEQAKALGQFFRVDAGLFTEQG